MTHTSKKWAFLLILIIAGALVVGYGFNRIEHQQHTQNNFAHRLDDTKESQRAACRAANILRASTNVNSYGEYQAWVTYANTVKVPPITAAARKALRPVLEQTWIPLTDCTVPPPTRSTEGYPVPSAVRFSVRPPPADALVVPPGR